MKNSFGVFTTASLLLMTFTFPSISFASEEKLNSCECQTNACTHLVACAQAYSATLVEKPCGHH